MQNVYNAKLSYLGIRSLVQRSFPHHSSKPFTASALTPRHQSKQAWRGHLMDGADRRGHPHQCGATSQAASCHSLLRGACEGPGALAQASQTVVGCLKACPQRCGSQRLSHCHLRCADMGMCKYVWREEGYHDVGQLLPTIAYQFVVLLRIIVTTHYNTRKAASKG